MEETENSPTILSQINLKEIKKEIRTSFESVFIFFLVFIRFLFTELELLCIFCIFDCEDFGIGETSKKIGISLQLNNLVSNS